jgi:2-haloacid dehalogenase
VAVTATPPSAVVFDLGGVLIDWNPRYLYRSLFGGDDLAMERFLADVCSPAWNLELDAGRSWPEAIDELAARFPAERSLIEAYRARWAEMLGGPIEGTVAILDELRRRGGPGLYALSNWSSETFAIARPQFEFLDWFDAVLISGDVGVAKPDPRIFEHFLARHGLAAESTIYIDDAEANVAAARGLGFQVIHFIDSDALRRELAAAGLLPNGRSA